MALLGKRQIGSHIGCEDRQGRTQLFQAFAMAWRQMLPPDQQVGGQAGIDIRNHRPGPDHLAIFQYDAANFTLFDADLTHAGVQ